jgi:NAD(P)H dehydrogenase (quinone)
MADAEAEGVREAGLDADMYQYPTQFSSSLTIRVPETLSEDVLTKMYAAPKPNDPVATLDTLTQYDHFLFGNLSSHVI